MSKTDGNIEAPSWTRSPKLNTCYLKAVRGKEFIAHHREISRQKWTVFGRSKESCDVQLLHGSVSRHHAALGHGESGNIYLVDLGSTHGTFLNGQRIEPNRRMVLADGDQLRFGESTRNYVVRLVDPRLVERNATTVEEALKESGEALKEEAEVEGGKVAPSRKRPAGPEERVRCRHVLIKHCESRRPTSHKGKITRTKEEALEVIERIRRELDGRPELFADVAQRESDCSSYATGGDLGFFGRGRMQQTFEKASFKLERGEMSGVVESNSGFHVVLRIE